MGYVRDGYGRLVEVVMLKPGEVGQVPIKAGQETGTVPYGPYKGAFIGAGYQVDDQGNVTQWTPRMDRLRDGPLADSKRYVVASTTERMAGPEAQVEAQRHYQEATEARARQQITTGKEGRKEGNAGGGNKQPGRIAYRRVTQQSTPQVDDSDLMNKQERAKALLKQEGKDQNQVMLEKLLGTMIQAQTTPNVTASPQQHEQLLAQLVAQIAQPQDLTKKTKAK